MPNLEKRTRTVMTSLASEAVEKFANIEGQTCHDFEMKCRKHLNDNHAEAVDYAELNEMFASRHQDQEVQP